MTKTVSPNLADTYAGKKILITGGLGFIGSTLAHSLVKFGAEVLLVDSLFPEYGGNMFNIHGIESKVTVNISDVRDRHSMNYLVKGKDYIFNLAGTLSHIDSMRDPFTDLEINCVAQLSILEAVRHNNPGAKILFAGTRGQYGRAEKLPVTENHLMRPTDVNGINNMAGEWYHILYNNVYGIRATSLRLTNTFGPRHQMKHARQGILNWFIRQAIDGEKIRIYGEGVQIRDTNYVDDVVQAMLLAMINDATNGQVYNLGGTPISLKDFVETMKGIHKNVQYEFVPFPPDAKNIEIGDYIADFSKFSKTTGWKPLTPLEEGIKTTLDYYTHHKKHYW